MSKFIRRVSDTHITVNGPFSESATNFRHCTCIWMPKFGIHLHVHRSPMYRIYHESGRPKLYHAVATHWDVDHNTIKIFNRSLLLHNSVWFWHACYGNKCSYKVTTGPPLSCHWAVTEQSRSPPSCHWAVTGQSLHEFSMGSHDAVHGQSRSCTWAVTKHSLGSHRVVTVP